MTLAASITHNTTTATKTAGLCGLFFDMTASTKGTGSWSLHKCLWEITSAPAGFELKTTYKRPNIFQGTEVDILANGTLGTNFAFYATHAGDYTIRLTITDAAGNTDTDEVTISVAAQSGVTTIYLDGTATGANDGTSETDAYTDPGTAATAFEATGGNAILKVAKGQTYVPDSSVSLGASFADGLIEAYGTGTDPVIDIKNLGGSGKWIQPRGENVVFKGIRFGNSDHPFSGTTGEGDALSIGNNFVCNGLVAVDCGLSSIGRIRSFMEQTLTNSDDNRILFQNCDTSLGAVRYSGFFGGVKRFVDLGSHIGPSITERPYRFSGSGTPVTSRSLHYSHVETSHKDCIRFAGPQKFISLHNCYVNLLNRDDGLSPIYGINFNATPGDDSGAENIRVEQCHIRTDSGPNTTGLTAVRAGFTPAGTDHDLALVGGVIEKLSSGGTSILALSDALDRAYILGCTILSTNKETTIVPRVEGVVQGCLFDYSASFDVALEFDPDTVDVVDNDFDNTNANTTEYFRRSDTEVRITLAALNGLSGNSGNEAEAFAVDTDDWVSDPAPNNATTPDGHFDDYYGDALGSTMVRGAVDTATPPAPPPSPPSGTKATVSHTFSGAVGDKFFGIVDLSGSAYDDWRADIDTTDPTKGRVVIDGTVVASHFYNLDGNDKPRVVAFRLPDDIADTDKISVDIFAPLDSRDTIAADAATGSQAVYADYKVAAPDGGTNAASTTQGTPSGVTIGDTTGDLGLSTTFDLNTDVIDYGQDTAGLSPIGQSQLFAIGLGVDTSATGGSSSNQRNIVSDFLADGNGEGQFFRLYRDQSGVVAAAFRGEENTGSTPGATIVTGTGSSIADSSPHTISCRKDGTALSVFRDGVEDGTGTHSRAAYHTEGVSQFQIGNFAQSNRPWGGEISHIYYGWFAPSDAFVDEFSDMLLDNGTFWGTPVIDQAEAPTITDPVVTALGETTASVRANITDDGGLPVTERGVVYALTATNANPEIGGTGVTKVAEGGTSTGVFTTDLTGLTTDSGYSAKAYAINAEGTSYTDVVTFTPEAPLALLEITDGDGNEPDDPEVRNVSQSGTPGTWTRRVYARNAAWDTSLPNVGAGISSIGSITSSTQSDGTTPFTIGSDTLDEDDHIIISGEFDYSTAGSFSTVTLTITGGDGADNSPTSVWNITVSPSPQPTPTGGSRSRDRSRLR